jgi:phosphohistidine phosphatase
MMNTINPSFRFNPLGDGGGGGGKTLVLVRHAKSSWDNVALTDFERPLNERGKNDAPKMAKLLKQKNIFVDAFISSPAKRAIKTAGLFMKEFERKEKEMILIPALYHATAETFYETINAIDDALQCVAIFSHNPGITYFAKGLAENIQIDNMPTCSIFAVKSTIKSWSDFKDSKKDFLFFEYPKKN